MDEMNFNRVIDVPDTPDRLTSRNIGKRSVVEDEKHGSLLPCRSERYKSSEDGSKHHQAMAVEGGSKRLFLRLPKPTTGSGSFVHPRRIKGVTEESSSYRSGDSEHTQNINVERPSCKLIDVTERNPHRHAHGNGFKGGVSVGSRESKEKLTNGVSCSHGAENKSTTLGHARKGNDNTSKVSSATGYSKGGFSGNVENKSSNGVVFRHPTSAPAVENNSSSGVVFRALTSSPAPVKQKKLVRNGCISPSNVAKAKQSSDKDVTSSVAVAHNRNYASDSSSSLPVSVDIMDLVAEHDNSRTRKGKGVLHQPCLSEEPDFGNKNLAGRSSVSFSEKGKSAEESSGWISTRSRPAKRNLSSSDDELFVIAEMHAARHHGQQHETIKSSSERGHGLATNDDHPRNSSCLPSESSFPKPLRQSTSNQRAQMGRLDGPHAAARPPLAKRQKRGPKLSSSGECSTSIPHDPEVVFLESSAGPSIPRSTSRNTNNSRHVVEINESPLEARRDRDDEDARARQLEADERMARELQDQLYSEAPVFGDGEFDAHIALAMQHEDDHALPRATRPVSNARRGSQMPNARQSRSRPSLNHPRRGSQSRASTSARMARLRNSFPGHPRTLVPSRGRTSMFPADMDIDTRMHILGALEDIAELEVPPGIQDGFDESFFLGLGNEQRRGGGQSSRAAGIIMGNDYEMLLALDENNDRHTGASSLQINGLPQSTVQNANFDEVCAVCLETPTIGDTIRHLPCLHKFHKDCIDPWLRRRTSCPICKSSIT